jgi:hypothetical protein
MTKRFYVTMTWHDWPEGGSYGTVVEAASFDEAEQLCRAEMAQHYVDDDPDNTPDRILAEFDHQWHLVDCFDLDEFIKDHT